MDPNETLKTIIDAIHECERDEAVYALRDLADWLERAGVFPDVTY